MDFNRTFNYRNLIITIQDAKVQKVVINRNLAIILVKKIWFQIIYNKKLSVHQFYSFSWNSIHTYRTPMTQKVHIDVEAHLIFQRIYSKVWYLKFIFE